MMMNHDPKLVAKAIKHLPDTFRNCREIAEAMVATNQPIVGQSWWSKLGNMTDYEKTRQRSLANIGSIIERLQQQTDEELRADIIRATAHLQQIAGRCWACPQNNLRNLRDNKPFVCLANDQPSPAPPNKFRFRLDSRGRVVESR